MTDRPRAGSDQALPQAFRERPVAHRGLHDAMIPENSLAAFDAAIAQGYGIELDIQPSRDGTPIVFHDYALDRLCDKEGHIAELDLDAIGKLRLKGTSHGVPTLAQTLDHVRGRVPLLIEIKDQDGHLGPNVGTLQSAVADLLRSYDGPVAVMSFNPHCIAAFKADAPAISAGLVSCRYEAGDWPMLDPEQRHRLSNLEDYQTSGASFISHHHLDLANPAVTALRADGVPVLCWTIRSEAEAATALEACDNITFEGFLP